MIEGGNQRTWVNFEGSVHTYTNKTRNLFSDGDHCATTTGFVGEENGGILRRSDIEYTLLGDDNFKYSVFNSFGDGVNNSLIHSYEDFPWLEIGAMLAQRPVIVDVSDDGVTVTGDTGGTIRASYDEAAGAWVFAPIVMAVNDGAVSESFLPEDIIIVNRSRSDIILNGIAFTGNVQGTNSVKIVSGRDTDLYIWGDITQRISHPDVPGGFYSSLEKPLGGASRADASIRAAGTTSTSPSTATASMCAKARAASLWRSPLLRAPTRSGIYCKMPPMWSASAGRCCWKTALSTLSTTAATSPLPTTRQRTSSSKARALETARLSSTSAKTTIRLSRSPAIPASAS